MPYFRRSMRSAGRHVTRGRLSIPVLGLAVALPFAAHGQTASFGTIENPYASAGRGGGVRIHALSGDGTVAVGSAWTDDFATGSLSITGEQQAIRWTASGGTRGLGFLPGSTLTSTYANAVSWNGSVVVGAGAFRPPNLPFEIHAEAFRWTASGGMQRLGLGGYTDSVANGVSADGSIVVGTLSASGAGAFTRFPRQAFRWTATGGIERLGFLPGAMTSEAAAVSGDGTVIVGSSGLDAFRWTAADGMRRLAWPAEEGWLSAAARAVSFDGGAIAGDLSAFPRTQAFRWTAAGGTVPLGVLLVATPPDWLTYPDAVRPFSSAQAISADGAIVVGTSGLVQARTSSRDVVRFGEAFRWSAAGGMQSIPALLAAAGVDLGGNRLDVATGITTTGPGGTNIIVGISEGSGGRSAWSWIVRLPDPRDGTGDAGFTTPEVLLASLGQVPSAAATAERIVWSAQREALLLAEHYGGTLSADRPVAGFVQARGAGWDRSDEWGTAFGGAAGVILRVGAAARAGLAVSATGQDSRGGTPELRTSVDGVGGRIFGLVGDTAAGPRLAVAFGYDQLQADVRRRYATSASAEAVARGRTDGQALSASLRAAWAIPVGATTAVSPFVTMHAVSTRLGAYAEGAGSGPFPARFDTLRQTGTVAGLGAEVEHRFAGGSRAWGSLGYSWRLSGDTSAVSGSFVDLFAFDLRGLPVAERRWVEGAVGGALALSPRVQTVAALGGALPVDGGGRYSLFSSLGLLIGF